MGRDSRAAGRPAQSMRLGPALAFGALFALGMVLGAGALTQLGQLAVQGFELVAKAHYEIHLASQNVNADGLPEYAVLLTDEAAYRQLQAFAAERGDLPVRRSSLPGWAIVALTPGAGADALEQLRAAPFLRAVLQNRGLWICH